MLRRAGYDPYEMNNEARREALLKLSEEQYGIYAESAQNFLQYMEEMEKVRELGGLHVIGSERHEARRIDNQLRGRSSRQGDPGSSRFYLSLEDDLMRMFGGQQVETMLSRLNIDESLPIENNIVAKLVEQSQTRVEGANFDVRKHLLEYDDVLNMQRKRIYEQRDRVFTKEDLSEDVLDMLRHELRERIPNAFGDQEGPWKLLAYLDEIQPPIDTEILVYPSYSIKLLFEDIKRDLGEAPVNVEQLRQALLRLARKALEAEREHILKAAEILFEKTEETLNQQREERLEILDTFFQTLPDRIEEAGGQIRAQELLDELSGSVRMPLRLQPDEMRLLAEGDDGAADALRGQVADVLQDIALTRLIGAMQRRIEDLDIRPSQFQNKDWESSIDQLFGAVESVSQARIERLAGENGQIAADLKTALEKADGNLINLDQNLRAVLGLLMLMMQGTRLTFDQKTHRRGRQRVIRLTYVFYAGKLIEEHEPNELAEDIIKHLEGAKRALQILWGHYELGRLVQTESTLVQLTDRVKEQLIEMFGEEHFRSIASTPLRELSAEDAGKIVTLFGARLQNEIYRDVLLGVISQLWVDYLTRVDALRVSIGLEAYAQRDPLVQYKGRASEMFKELLGEIRSGVVARMFTYQPRRSAAVSAGQERAEAEPVSATTAQSGPESRSSRKKKRRRH